MALAKKAVEDNGVVEFRSKYPRLVYNKPEKVIGNKTERGFKAVFRDGSFRTVDPFVIDQMRDAITRMPIASDGHGLKGWVTEQEEILDPEQYVGKE